MEREHGSKVLWERKRIGAALQLFPVVAMLASWLPARRAAKVDPMEALRYE